MADAGVGLLGWVMGGEAGLSFFWVGLAGGWLVGWLVVVEVGWGGKGG